MAQARRHIARMTAPHVNVSVSRERLRKQRAACSARVCAITPRTRTELVAITPRTYVSVATVLD